MGHNTRVADLGVLIRLRSAFQNMVRSGLNPAWEILPIKNKSVLRFLIFFSKGHPQQKVGISQEFAGKGCLYVFLV